MFRSRRALSLALVVVLAGLGWFGYRAWNAQHLHRPVSAADIVEVKAVGDLEKAGPLDPATIVSWLNAGTVPRRSPGNVGHTTTYGALILELKSGGRVGLWPEGEDFLVAQNGNYYYLKQPDLKRLLRRLDGQG